MRAEQTRVREAQPERVDAGDRGEAERGEEQESGVDGAAEEWPVEAEGRE